MTLPWLSTGHCARNAFPVSLRIVLSLEQRSAPSKLFPSAVLWQIHHHTDSDTHMHHTRLVKRCEIAEGIRSHYFGAGLTEVEQQWIVSEIGAYLHNTRAK